MGKHRKPYQSSKPKGFSDLVARLPGRHRAGEPEPEPWVYSPDANPDATVILDSVHGPGSADKAVTEPEEFWKEDDQYDEPSDGRSRLAARAAVLVSAVALVAVGGVAYLLGRGSAEEAGRPVPAVTVTVTEPGPTATVRECFEANLSGDLVETNCP